MHVQYIFRHKPPPICNTIDCSCIRLEKHLQCEKLLGLAGGTTKKCGNKKSTPIPVTTSITCTGSFPCFSGHYTTQFLYWWGDDQSLIIHTFWNVRAYYNHDDQGRIQEFWKGGAVWRKFLLKKCQQFFFQAQCNYSYHGLIDDSMTYIVARDSRNGWNLALQLQKSTTWDCLLFCMLQ